MFKHFKLTIMAVMAVALLVSAACSGDTETIIQTVIVPGDTVVETVIVPGDTVVETVIVEVPGAHIRDIPRNRTLISALKSGLPPVEMWSPYNLGGTH